MNHVTATRPRLWLGVILLGFGLLGHLLAAQAIGGSYVAYGDHIGGFVILTLVSGALLAGLGWRFWRGRYDITQSPALTLAIPRRTGWLMT
jgi:hypothetical protein